jgi:hypothetical protein
MDGAVQNVSVVNGYMDAKDFHQKYGTGHVGVKKRMSRAAGGRSRIMFYGPKSDGRYVVEFETDDGEALAISVPVGKNLSAQALPGAHALWAIRAGRSVKAGV